MAKKWECKVGNNGNIDNLVLLWKTRLETSPWMNLFYMCIMKMIVNKDKYLVVENYVSVVQGWSSRGVIVVCSVDNLYQQTRIHRTTDIFATTLHLLFRNRWVLFFFKNKEEYSNGLNRTMDSVFLKKSFHWTQENIQNFFHLCPKITKIDTILQVPFT